VLKAGSIKLSLRITRYMYKQLIVFTQMYEKGNILQIVRGFAEIIKNICISGKWLRY